MAENGKTGWPVMYALTRALQYELGITALSDSFGPTTLAALQSRFPVVDAGTRHGNAYRIVQSALYCKGYDGGNIDGTFNSRVSTWASLLVSTGDATRRGTAADCVTMRCPLS